jgi:hypothetical protein
MFCISLLILSKWNNLIPNTKALCRGRVVLLVSMCDAAVTAYCLYGGQKKYRLEKYINFDQCFALAYSY